MARPRGLLTRLTRTVEPDPVPPPPSEGFSPNGQEGTPSEREQRLEGARVLSELYRRQDERKRRGEDGPVLGYHVGTGWGPR